MEINKILTMTETQKLWQSLTQQIVIPHDEDIKNWSYGLLA
jgi:hypothetical protein